MITDRELDTAARVRAHACVDAMFDTLVYSDSGIRIRGHIDVDIHRPVIFVYSTEPSEFGRPTEVESSSTTTLIVRVTK